MPRRQSSVQLLRQQLSRHSTLRFASRAKSVKNKPIVNKVLSDTALPKHYAKEIKNLKLSLEKEGNTDKAQEVVQMSELLDEQVRRNQELEGKVNELKAKLVVSSHQYNYLRDWYNKKKKKIRLGQLLQHPGQVWDLLE